MRRISTPAGLGVLVAGLCFTTASCNKNPDQPAEQGLSSDPAQVNLASAGGQTIAQVPPPQSPVLTTGRSVNQQPPAYSSQNSQSQTYPAQTYPAQPVSQAQPQADGGAQYPDGNYAPYPQDTASAEEPVEAEQPPPPLPTYSQPPCPGDNYIWTPGYWSYASAGYYWVPGAWVVAPYVGALWTPPYWKFADSRYRFNRGYWGSHIGYYGGINYGSGYTGRGYEGGYWDKNRRAFAYNRSVNNVNTAVVRNVYNYNVANNNNLNISYNGGRGGTKERPTPGELAVLHENRIAPLPAQLQSVRQAAANRTQFADVNHGRPPVLAAPRPLPTAYQQPSPHPAAVPGAQPLPPANISQRAPAASQPPQQAQQSARPNQIAAPSNVRPQVPITQAPAAQVRINGAQPAPAVHASLPASGQRPENGPAQPPQSNRSPAYQPPPTRQHSGSQMPVAQQPPARPPQQSPVPPAVRVTQQPPVQPTPRPMQQSPVQPTPRITQQPPVPPQPRVETQPRAEQRPTAQPRVDPQPHVVQQPPVQPQPRVETQPRAEQRPTAQPRPEAAPKPQSKPNPPHGEGHDRSR